MVSDINGNLVTIREYEGLNPSCSGVWSLTFIKCAIDLEPRVLILLVVEYGL